MSKLSFVETIKDMNACKARLLPIFRNTLSTFILLITVASCASVDSDKILQLDHSEKQPAIKIVPLIETASIYIDNTVDTSSISIFYKRIDSTEWLPVHFLEKDPLSDQHSTAIRALAANTEYSVKAIISREDESTVKLTKAFVTWPNTPPIDPNKIYFLKDLYDGSPLNLEELNINGHEDGWALIIGDSSTPIKGRDNAELVNIGNNSYIKFENITIEGGGINAIRSENAHHLWFSNLDISDWGRKAKKWIKGVAYPAITINQSSKKRARPINYDSALNLERSGSIVIENTLIHDPAGKANSWKNGHPNGPNAFLVSANHPNPKYQGQIVLRNNRFFGTKDHRFNDVIESRKNGKRYGGFIRDSAIYNNYFAYANDDIIELDGGQQNVQVFNNILEQGFCAISVVPNMQGPSFLISNTIKNLGDQDGKSWTAIKAGGLKSRPEGRTYILDNLIITNNNGVAPAGYDGDSNYRAYISNNTFIKKKGVGKAILLPQEEDEVVIKDNIVLTK